MDPHPPSFLGSPRSPPHPRFARVRRLATLNPTKTGLKVCLLSLCTVPFFSFNLNPNPPFLPFLLSPLSFSFLFSPFLLFFLLTLLSFSLSLSLLFLSLFLFFFSLTLNFSLSFFFLFFLSNLNLNSPFKLLFLPSFFLLSSFLFFFSPFSFLFFFSFFLLSLSFQTLF